MKIVIATSRKWNEHLANDLRAKGHEVTLVVSKDELSQEMLRNVAPRYIFFPHWSYVIPKEIHENYECVIFHMTDVPFGRGGSPLQNLIVRGHTKTKVSALKCVEEMDAGPVYLKKDLSLEGRARDIFHRTSEIILSMIEEIISQTPIPKAQVGNVTIFKRRRPEESEISNIGELSSVYDFIRMLDAEGYPKAFLETPSMRFEFNDAELNEDSVVAKVTITRKKNV